jgi:hypothetical protein
VYFEVMLQYADAGTAVQWIVDHCELDLGDFLPEE